MYTRWIILIAAFLLLSAGVELAAAQTSAQSSQEQGLNNTQEIVTGNQTVVLQSTNALRSFSIPGNAPLPPYLPIPSHFAQPVTDGNFGSLLTLLGYKTTFTAEEAEALAHKHGKMRMITTSYLPKDSRKPTSRLSILPDLKDKSDFNRQYEQIGVGNYKALGTDIISEQVLGTAILEGLKMGANTMVFQEGASLVQVASGFSLGLFNSFSFVSNGTGNGNGNVSVGGIGFGKGQSSYSSRPWLRILFFREKESQPQAANDHLRTMKPLPEQSGIMNPPHRSMPADTPAEPAHRNVPDSVGFSAQPKGVNVQMTPAGAGPQGPQGNGPSIRPAVHPVSPVPFIRTAAWALPSDLNGKAGDENVRNLPQTRKLNGFYQVQEGDTLSGIAGKTEVYGNPLKWPILYRMNLKTLGNLPEDHTLPHSRIPAGTKIRIVTPEEVKKNIGAHSNRWVVSVYSAASEDEAVPIVVNLAKKDFAPYLSSARVKGKDWLRVRVGFFDGPEVERKLEKIMDLLGLNNSWVDKVNEMEFREFAGYRMQIEAEE